MFEFGNNLTEPLGEWNSDQLCLHGFVRFLNLSHFSTPGQGGQQVVTQIIRGQAVSTAISAASPVTTVTGQGVASPNTAVQTAGQTPPGTPRTQGQGQVKLTMAQLTQLTQVCEGKNTHPVLPCVHDQK